MSPHETFLQHLNQKLENSLPIILVGLSLFRMIDVFLKEVCTSIYSLTEHGLEVVDLQDI